MCRGNDDQDSLTALFLFCGTRSLIEHSLNILFGYDLTSGVASSRQNVLELSAL